MKLFHPPALFDLTICLQSVPAVHEHSAWRCEYNFETDAQKLGELGHILVKDVPGIAMFFVRPGSEVRIELIGRDREEHEAWAVPTLQDFRRLDLAFQNVDRFTPTGEFYDTPTLKAKLFRHVTGTVVQIVWREEQIYKDIFPQT
jgi:hypothetical protein